MRHMEVNAQLTRFLGQCSAPPHHEHTAVQVTPKMPNTHACDSSALVPLCTHTHIPSGRHLGVHCEGGSASAVSRAVLYSLYMLVVALRWPLTASTVLAPCVARWKHMCTVAPLASWSARASTRMTSSTFWHVTALPARSAACISAEAVLLPR